MKQWRDYRYRLHKLGKEEKEGRARLRRVECFPVHLSLSQRYKGVGEEKEVPHLM